MRMAAAEHRGDPREDEERAANEAEPAQASWHEPGGVHQVAENEAVPPADDESRPEDERPVLERRERVGDRPFVATRILLREGHDGKDGQDPDEDERALDDPRRDVADREDGILPPYDRIDDDG